MFLSTRLRRSVRVQNFCLRKGEISVKKKFVSCVIAAVILLCAFGVSAFADTGPKPSVRIKFENLSTSECWGTLLSADPSTGPAFAWDGTPGSEQFNDNKEIWHAFEEYEDDDGYFFLQRFWNCGESKSLDWTYYPPDDFKILLYFPETGEYAVSEKCRSYAFHSYFTADVSGLKTVKTTAGITTEPTGAAQTEKTSENADGVVNPTENDGSPAVIRDYDYTADIVSFFVRMLICVAVELLIAVLFGFCEKKLMLMILIANVCTQIFLNGVLSIMVYKGDGFELLYFLLELFVLAAEIAVYCLGFKKVGRGDISRARIIIYTVVANTVSFLGGFMLALAVPVFF